MTAFIHTLLIALDARIREMRVSSPCLASAQPMDVLMLKDQPGSGTESKFTITYDAGTFDMPFGIALCPAKCSDSDHAATGF